MNDSPRQFALQADEATRSSELLQRLLRLRDKPPGVIDVRQPLPLQSDCRLGVAAFWPTP
jgi:hypothetical protein